MLLRPSLLQQHFEVKLSLAESPCSAAEETEAGEVQDLEGRQQFTPKPAGRAPRARLVTKLPEFAGEQLDQAENKSIQ